MSLKTDLDKLATAIAKGATGLLAVKKPNEKTENPINLQEAIDAFKALTQYYAVQLKTKKKGDDEPEGEENFADFAESSREPERPNGRKAQIPDRRANN